MAMIYLIGGPPRCGKTTVAKLLSKKTGASWISTDTLEALISTYVSKDGRDLMFPKRKMRIETKRSNDLLYSKFTTKEIVAAYKEQSKSVWKALEMLVQVELKQGRDYIVEGYHIHPKLIKTLVDKHGTKNIRSVILLRLDEEQTVLDCLKSTAKNDWLLQNTKDPNTYTLIAQMVVEFSAFFKKEAVKKKIQVVEMDAGFKKQAQLAVKVLQEQGF